ncbi:MAG: PAS domain S-box protein [Thermoplasmata archaeon]|nr:PAS domain S-box protein [Thermoplasmata archaeon]MBE3140393.1 PAS domain S-box protein [Thermoplasmata archaeon]
MHGIMIIVFALFSLIGSVICLFFGNFVYYQNRKQLLNKIFFLLCMSLAFWAFTEFMLRQAESLETANFWFNMNFLWPFSLAFPLHFMLIYTEKTSVLKNKLTYLLVYAPAFIFSFGDLLVPSMRTEPIMEFWGYSYYVLEGSWMYLVSEVWVFTVGFLALVLGIMYYRQVYSEEKKRQAKFVILGFSIPIITGFFTEGFPPVLQIKIPELTTLAFTGLCVCVGYAIFEHKLFVFTPATVAENIIETMNDSLLLVDKHGIIMKVNHSLLNLLGYSEDEIVGQPMEKLFAEEQSGKNINNKFLENKTFDNYETKYKTKTGENVDISFSGSTVNIKDGTFVGFIGIGHNITDRKKAEEKLKEKIDELEKYKKLTVGRELKMIEMKKEIDELCNKLGEKPRYAR